ncbi:MAG: type IV toxin-antitoxin system AbiEi family antitoxin domain-containing protein [Candidatus Micrarchaeia archaeon]
MKYVKKFREHFYGVPVFTTNDARLFLSSLGASREYVYLFLNHLLRKGEIRRIKKGTYTFGSDPMLAGFAYRPSYHGLQDALSVLGLWDQETNTILITPLKVRGGVHQMLGGKIIVRRISRKMFFGFEMKKYFDYWIAVSDVEKTLIDFVYFKEPLQQETLEEIKKRIDKKKMGSYLKKCPAGLEKQVLSLLE